MGSARRTVITSLMTFALAASACSSESGTTAPAASPTSDVTATTEASPSTSSTTPTGDAPAVDRLLVVDQAGNVVTMDPDGGNQNALTDDAGAAAGYFQPTWSPFAHSVAVTRIDAEGFSLVRYGIESGERAEVATESNAFYLYWSPAGDRLGYLSNGPATIALKLADFEDADSSVEIDLGQPFYFAWSPDGEQLATLIAGQLLEVRAATGDAPKAPIATPGAFQNPAWTDAGLVYVTNDDGVNQLVIGEPNGGRNVLAVTPASAIFTAPQSGARVAVQVRGEIDGVSASLQAPPTVPLNRLVVIDTATGAMTQVTDAEVIAYFWDPAGDQLLILDDDAPSGRLRWSVWNGDEVLRLTEFLPSRVFLNTFLPFFGQYALSTTMWAPDGSAFAFAGFVGEQGGIFVQDASGGDPRFVAGGSWVTWSPR